MVRPRRPGPRRTATRKHTPPRAAPVAGPAAPDDAPGRGRGVELPVELVQRMASGQASPADLRDVMTSLGVDLVREMAGLRRPFDAELLMSHAFGGGLASAMEADCDWGQADDLQVEAFGPMVDQVAVIGSEDALALLRVMTMLGPPKLREQAHTHTRDGWPAQGCRTDRG